MAAGIDPSMKRKGEKVAQANTFKALAEEWLTHESKTLSAVTIRAKRARLETWAYGSIGNTPIADIEPPELLAILKRVESTGRHETAHRVRQAVGGVFQYAILSHRAKRDPTVDLHGALVPVVESHHAGLTDPRAFGSLLRAIDGYHGQPVTEIALRLTPLVFVRPGELRKAEWKEFHIAGSEPLWRIPAEKMKMKREHLVPLARQAVALLKEAEKHTAGGKYVFPTSHNPMRPMSENTIRGALLGLGYSSDVHTPHGFRTTASTLLNELGFNPELIEMQLAHEEQSGLELPTTVRRSLASAGRWSGVGGLYGWAQIARQKDRRRRSEARMTILLVSRKRGRQPVPGKEAAHREIAGLVYYIRQRNEEHVRLFGRGRRTVSPTNDSLNYARNSVARDLGVHVATVPEHGEPINARPQRSPKSWRLTSRYPSI